MTGRPTLRLVVSIAPRGMLPCEVAIEVDDLSVEALAPDVLALSFALPKGSYALAVLREVLKNTEFDPAPDWR